MYVHAVESDCEVLVGACDLNQHGCFLVCGGLCVGAGLWCRGLHLLCGLVERHQILAGTLHPASTAGGPTWQVYACVASCGSCLAVSSSISLVHLAWSATLIYAAAELACVPNQIVKVIMALWFL